jgi:hypothetical protein
LGFGFKPITSQILRMLFLFPSLIIYIGDPGSSVSKPIVSGYGLDDRENTMGTGGPFPGAKARPGRYADHSSPSSA